MRLVLLVPSLSEGGAARVITTLANGWAARGVRVSVVTLAGARGDLFELDDEVRRIALGLTEPSLNPVVGVLRNAERVSALRSVIRRISPDAAIAFLPRTSVLTVLAATGTGVPVVVSERADPRRVDLPLVWRVLRRVAYRRAASLVVQTEDVADWARGWLPDGRIHVVPNPVREPEATTTEAAVRGPETAGSEDPAVRAPTTHLVVGMGRLVRQKGFDLLMRAFARCVPEHPDWSLVIVGEGPDRQRLDQLSEQLGVGARVRLPGRVPAPWRRLGSVDLFVLSSRFEGFPNVLLEAMARGIACVSFDCPSGPSEIVTHGEDGLLVPAGDVGGLAGALERLMGDPSERRALGRSARDVTERFGIDSVLDRWSEVVAAALE